MTKFHAGQDVEVWQDVAPLSHAGAHAHWRKAKIIARTRNRQWALQFPDGSRAMFDAEHIRVVSP